MQAVAVTLRTIFAIKAASMVFQISNRSNVLAAPVLSRQALVNDGRPGPAFAEGPVFEAQHDLRGAVDRNDADGSPSFGEQGQETVITDFDSAGTQNQLGLGNWESIVLHEMLHAMGFGTLWSLMGLTSGSVAGGIFALRARTR